MPAGHLTRSGASGIRNPYGKPGDRLWVRETWRTGGVFDGKPPRTITAGCIDAGYPRPGAPIWYDADQSYRSWGDNDYRDFDGMGEKRVAIFMPRWASRITLEITDVRVQRWAITFQRVERAAMERAA